MDKLYSKLGQRTRELREKGGISQERLSELLGISRPAVSQMEAGERKISAEELIKLSEIFRLSLEDFIDSEKQPEIVLLEGGKKEEAEPQIRISVPQKNLEKFKEVFLYILNKVGSKPNIGETVIYKLLYFIDFNFYEKYEEQLIGAAYLKNRFGPTPVEFKKIVDRMIEAKEITKVENKHFQYPQKKYLPLRKPDLSKIKANELEVIDTVLARLSDMNAAEISNYSHGDVPWLTTEDGKIIKYESVFLQGPALLGKGVQ